MGTDRSNGRRGSNDNRGRGVSTRGRGLAGGRSGNTYQSTSNGYSGSDYSSYNNSKQGNTIHQNSGYGYNTQRSYGQSSLSQSYGADSYGSTYQYRGTTY